MIEDFEKLILKQSFHNTIYKAHDYLQIADNHGLFYMSVIIILKCCNKIVDNINVT